MQSQRVYPNYYKKDFFFFFTIYINEWKEQILTTKKLKKKNFYKNKKITSIDDIDVNKILASKKEPKKFI